MNKPTFWLGGLIVLAAVLLIGLTVNRMNRFEFALSPAEIQAKIKSGDHLLPPQGLAPFLAERKAQLIDLRPQKAFQQGSLPGAVHLSLDRILDEDSRAFFSETGPKVLFDQTGIGANEAWVLLTRYGFEELYVLEGGYAQWMAFAADTTEAFGYEDEAPVKIE